MTNHWKDIKNADVVLVMGANPAENHPCGFKWALEARDENGAKLLTIDPRFTRTSAVADKHLQIRPGSDIAILGGLIRHILTNDLHHADYVRAHTNASFIISGDFGFEDGLFSGFEEAGSRYDKTSWSYQRAADGYVRRDPTLEDPQCVFQLLTRHYDRYTPAMVAQIAGCSEEKFLEMADIICSTGLADRVGTIMYAVGWTMHTVGSQIIRTGAILQLLLGNIGRPGGGINALRGHANVQGATDHAIVAGILPGYLKVPTPEQTTLAEHLEASTPKPLVPDTVNYWGNYPKFMVSLLKAWFGDSATAANEFGYHYLGKPDGDATWLSIWDEAYHGRLEGFITLGFNPLLAGPDIPRLLKSMSRLKWMTVIDPFMLDSAEFWKAPGMNPSEIDTEVLYLPTTHWIERDGSFINSGRWAQWKEKAIDPPDGVRPDTWVLSELFWRVKELYQQDGGAYDEPIQNLTWNYLNPREPLLTELAKEINGYDHATGQLLSSFGQLQADGGTSSGNWLYTGSYTEAGNMMARRGTADPTGLGMHHEWAFSWPANRRVLYNRASADAEGRPWDPTRAGIAWTGREWIGDVPDYGRTTPPDAAGAFIMTEEGVRGSSAARWPTARSPSITSRSRARPSTRCTNRCRSIRSSTGTTVFARRWRQKATTSPMPVPSTGWSSTSTSSPRTCRCWSRRCPTSSSRSRRAWRPRRGSRTAAGPGSGRNAGKSRVSPSSPSGSSPCWSTAGRCGPSGFRSTGGSPAAPATPTRRWRTC